MAPIKPIKQKSNDMLLSGTASNTQMQETPGKKLVDTLNAYINTVHAKLAKHKTEGEKPFIASE